MPLDETTGYPRKMRRSNSFRDVFFVLGIVTALFGASSAAGTISAAGVLAGTSVLDIVDDDENNYRKNDKSNGNRAAVIREKLKHDRSLFQTLTF